MDPDPHPTLRENVRALPPATWVLFAGTFVNRLGTFVLPFMTLYLTRRGYPPGQAGLAIAMYGVGGIGSQLVGGWLADRIGRRKAIALSMISASCLTLVLWRATSLAVIYPVMALLATAAEAHRPAASALIADLVPARGRVTAFAMFRLAINIGWAAGLTLGGLLAERSFSYLFIGDAVTSATFGVISLLALPHGVRTSHQEHRRLGGATRMILADRGLLLFLGSVLVGSAIYMQNVSSFPLHVRSAGHSAAVYGALQALNGVFVVLLEVPISSWSQRRSRLSMTAMGGLLVGLASARCSLPVRCRRSWPWCSSGRSARSCPRRSSARSWPIGPPTTPAAGSRRPSGWCSRSGRSSGPASGRPSSRRTPTRCGSDVVPRACSRRRSRSGLAGIRPRSSRT